MNRLLNALQMNQDEYENLVFGQWFQWCGHRAKTTEQLQQFLANTMLFNWWRMEYSAYERDFLSEIKPYVHSTGKRDALLLYIKNVYKMQLYFSKSLMKKAAENNIEHP